MESYQMLRTTNLFQALRKEGYPIRHPDNRIDGFFDLELFAIIFVVVSIGFSLLFILPGFRGKERIFFGIRCLVCVLIGFFIFVCNFEMGWERDTIDTTVRYKYGTGKQINATIGLHIGLRGINITLIGLPEHQIGETIRYNEHFSWEWSQGMEGFGPKSGPFNQDFRKSQYRGLPHPILSIAEYFTYDGEGLRFGRHYRLSGWLSVPLYLLSNLLFQMVIQYGALFLMLTGSSLITANILFYLIRNPIPLKIPFEQYMTENVIYLCPSLSWCFYLNLINGLFCVFLGIIIFVSDLRYPDQTAQFFGIDVLQSYEDYFAEIKVNTNIERKTDNGIEQQRFSEIYGLRKRNLSDRLSRMQKSSIRKKPMTHPRYKSPESSEYLMPPSPTTPLYENFQRFEPIGEEVEENQF